MEKNTRLRLRLHRQPWRLIGVILLLLAAASCASSPVNRAWVSADVRTLDPLDAPGPATDILAVYTRTTDLSVDIRVDLLDINAGDKYALKLSLWDDRNFSQDPLMVDISSTGAVQTGGIRPGKPVIWPRVIQNFGLDTVTVSLNRALIGSHYRVDISTYTTDPPALADEVPTVSSDARVQVGRAPMLLAFWDTFPAATPAQALRRWDGAHTGPLGDRHGLKHILNGAGEYGIPVVLLDIKNPASLAALNFMGILPEIKDMYAGDLLILPDVAFAEPADIALGFSRRAAAGFGLLTGQFIYTLSTSPAGISSGYRARFLPLTDTAHLASSGGMRLVPLPSADNIEATENGPSVDVRRALIAAALSSDPSDLVVLGGSLPRSTWGDSDMAYPTFEWIAAHPWIRPLAGQDILTFPARSQPLASLPAAPGHPWLEQLRAAPDNAISRSAWQTYLMLTAPTTDAQLLALRNAYLGQVGELLAAANWAKNPTPSMACTEDLNADGQAECVLANQAYFAVVELDGARLTQFYYSNEGVPHQLVGPSSQFAVGLSDPSEWQPERGQAADPGVIPGAFADETDTWIKYIPTIQADGIIFTSPDGSRIKTVHLTDNGIEVQYQVLGPLRTRIPLALDPQTVYFGPSNYRASFSPRAWLWSLASGPAVEVRTDASLSGQGFISALPFVSLAEDPNLGYPQGNYFPFPLSVVTIQSDGNFSVQIRYLLNK